MLPKGQDWASLCRDYRERHGLKQEAMAQDFNVDQSAVSRWERGIREPSLLVKQAILDDVLRSRTLAPDQTMRLLLEQSGSAVALWQKDGTLLGASRRFEREALTDENGGSLLQNTHILRHIMSILEAHGFFAGEVLLAVLKMNPFLQPRRIEAGGVIVVSLFPVHGITDELAVLAVHDHDVFAQPLEKEGEIQISFAGSKGGLPQISHSRIPGF